MLNINAFILVARMGSFTAAARELGVAPSVVTKRVTQLEAQAGAPLLKRSTRGLALTAAGERYLPRFLRLTGELEEIFSRPESRDGRVEGHLRIKTPTTVTVHYLGALFSDFQLANPGVRLDVVIMDRTINPLEEGFDLVIGARPAAYPHVMETPLCPYPLVLCGAPSYLQAKGSPAHPCELIDHDCLTSLLLGTTWVFEGATGALSVEVRSRFNANDSGVLLEAARRGLGLVMLPCYLADQPLRRGELARVLVAYPPACFWLKALVPRVKMHNRAVRELVAFLKKRMQPAPWEHDRIAGVATPLSAVQCADGGLRRRTALGGER